MRSSAFGVLIAVLVVAAVVFGGFLLYKKFSVSADEVSISSCSRADVNNDSKVNSLDLNILIKAISGGSTDVSKYDINSDKKVDSGDVDAQKDCWSRSSSSLNL